MMMWVGGGHAVGFDDLRRVGLGSAALFVGGAAAGPGGAIGGALLSEVAKAGLDPGNPRLELQHEITNVDLASKTMITEMMLRNGYWGGPMPPTDIWPPGATHSHVPADDPNTTGINEHEQAMDWIPEHALRHVSETMTEFDDGLREGRDLGVQ